MIYQMRKKINKGMKIFFQLVMLLDKDKIGACLAAARTAMKVANPAIQIQYFQSFCWIKCFNTFRKRQDGMEKWSNFSRWKNSCPQHIHRCGWCPQTSFAVYCHTIWCMEALHFWSYSSLYCEIRDWTGSQKSRYQLFPDSKWIGRFHCPSVR